VRDQLVAVMIILYLDLVVVDQLNGWSHHPEVVAGRPPDLAPAAPAQPSIAVGSALVW
jgi:hypothetical protein